MKKFTVFVVLVTLLFAAAILFVNELPNPAPTAAVGATQSLTEEAGTVLIDTNAEPKDGRIDLNTATKEELMTLPGVGETTALRIIEYREATPFTSVDDLLQVKGIGEKTLEKFRSLIKVQLPHEDAPAQSTATEASVQPTGQQGPVKLDPNTASKSQLMLLPGVGETIAQRIVESREGQSFRYADDLMRVKGIGEKTMEKLRPWILLDDRPVDADRTAPTQSVGQTAGVVNVNTATVEQLMSVPGIGEVLASRIVEYRAAAPFTDLSQLVKVRGIGEKTLEKMRPYLSVS
ncbi:helix-hairpin-helix domain-containing protein [Feifania hominis]|uniref:Helix-hairpin-helix domain-containing protein n=1 Tax=Feifania hominis TaxID=2763660 RepID=A0A926DCU1_9FIRM|nr:helix-hairpin-helix domain-containing protein [Feifania hominis]